MMSPRPKFFHAKHLNFADLWMVAIMMKFLSFYTSHITPRL